MSLLHDDRTVDERPVWADDELRDGTPLHTEPVVVRKNSPMQTLRTIVATVILVAIVAFVAMNSGHVDIDLGYDTMEMPLSAALGATAIAGVLVGWMFGYRRHRAHVD